MKKRKGRSRGGRREKEGVEVEEEKRKEVKKRKGRSRGGRREKEGVEVKKRKGRS